MRTRVLHALPRHGPTAARGGGRGPVGHMKNASRRLMIRGADKYSARGFIMPRRIGSARRLADFFMNVSRGIDKVSPGGGGGGGRGGHAGFNIAAS